MGSVTEINGAEIEAVDVITFGSPCQDLSVAGKRAGLKHSANGDDETTRSGLFMEAVRIIKEMRRATNGEYPKYAIWENVMGAFSSNSGEDFRVVLEELVKICEPEAPPIPSPGKAGWPYADCIVGDGWSLAYRVFDAQHWGVAQRRRRLYALLDLTGERAETILFERPGLRGYFTEGRTPWQGAAGNPQEGAGADDPESGCLTPWDVQSRRIFVTDGTWPSLYGGEGGGHGYVLQAEPITVATQQGGAEISEDGICPTVTAAAGMSGNNQPWICCPKAAQTFIIDNIGGQAEYGVESCVSSTLRAGTLGAVCYDARGNGDGDTVNTITGDHNNRITDYSSVITYATDVGFLNTCEDVSPTMLARMYKDPHTVAYGLDRASFNQGENAQYGFSTLLEQQPTLTARGPGAVCKEYIVRRLTPTECARLQGFPDRWGDIPQKDTLTDEEYSFWLDVRNTHAAINGRATKDYTREQLLKWYNKLHSDSSEYKMWGNGIALPNALYVMQGIAEVTKP